MPLGTENERLLIEEIKSDHTKFIILFEKYYPLIFRYTIRRILDYDISCDIVSETFLKAFLNIHKFEWKGISISFWLYRIATNEINQYFKKKKYYPTSLSSLINREGWDIIDPKTTPEGKLQFEKELNSHEEFLDIQEKIRTLPIKYQEVITLRYFEEKSIKEIGIILNKNENTVKSLILRGLEKIKNVMKNAPNP